MSFLTALLYGAGGYGAGRQQATVNKQAQEQIDAENQYRNADLQLRQQQAKQQADIYQRSIGIDPRTGKPPVLPPSLTQVSPNNKGHLPMVVDPATGKRVIDQSAVDQMQIDHLYKVANNYIQQGFPDLAAPYLDRAKGLESIVKQGQQNANILGREETMADYRNREPLNPWQQYQVGLNNQFGPPGMRLSPYQQFEEGQKLKYPPGSTSRGGKITPDQAQQARVTWQDKFTKATSGNLHYQYPQNPKGQQGKQEGKAPLVSAKDISDLRLKLQNARDRGGYKGPLDPFSAIDNDPDPLKTSQQLATMTGNPTLKSLLLERGRVANMQRQSQQQGGGSQSAVNPTSGGQLPPNRVPPDAIWQLLIQNGATPQEATTLTAVALAESSGGDANAVNPTDNGGKQTSWGLFQISDGTHNEPPGWNDPQINTQMAIQKLRSKQGLHAWGTYNSGAYRQYLPPGDNQ